METKTNVYKENLEKHHIKFKEQVIGFSLDLKRHLLIQKKYPDFTTLNQQGKKETIQEIVTNFRGGLINAQSYVEIIEDMLKSEEEGKLHEKIESFKLIPSIILEDDGKEQGKKVIA